MKVKAEKVLPPPHQFIPQSITLTFESQRELDLFGLCLIAV